MVFWGFNLGLNVGRLPLRRVLTRQNACVGRREWLTDGSIVDVRFCTMVLSFLLVRSNGVSGGKVFPPLVPVWWLVVPSMGGDFGFEGIAVLSRS